MLKLAKRPHVKRDSSGCSVATDSPKTHSSNRYDTSVTLSGFYLTASSHQIGGLQVDAQTTKALRNTGNFGEDCSVLVL